MECVSTPGKSLRDPGAGPFCLTVRREPAWTRRPGISSAAPGGPCIHPAAKGWSIRAVAGKVPGQHVGAPPSPTLPIPGDPPSPGFAGMAVDGKCELGEARGARVSPRSGARTISAFGNLTTAGDDNAMGVAGAGECGGPPHRAGGQVLRRVG